MLDIFGVPPWALSVPPLLAFVAVLAYLMAPQVREHTAFRSVLIASVALTAAEILAAVFILGLLVWFAASGGMQEF